MKKSILLLMLIIIGFGCTKNTEQTIPVGDGITKTETVDLSDNSDGLNFAISEWNYSQTSKNTYSNSVVLYLSPSYTIPGKYLVRNSAMTVKGIVNVSNMFNGEKYFEFRSQDYRTLHYSFTVDAQNLISNLKGDETSPLFNCLRTAYKYCFQQKACGIACNTISLLSLAGCGLGFTMGCVTAWRS